VKDVGFSSFHRAPGKVKDVRFSSFHRAPGKVKDVRFSSFHRAPGKVKDVRFSSFHQALGTVKDVCFLPEKLTAPESLSAVLALPTEAHLQHRLPSAHTTGVPSCLGSKGHREEE
jgi:hypothetical protein